MTLELAGGARYEVRVGGDGPGLLLLHGFTGRGSNWAAFLPVLRRSFTTVVVDLLGHGRSDSPRDPARHAVERQADDLALIIQRVGVGSAGVLGYSFGARVGLMLALRSPGVVGRLVLESPSAGIADPTERSARRVSDEALADAIERDGVEQFVNHWEALPLFASHSRLSRARRRDLHAGRLRNNADGLAPSLRGGGQGSMPSLLERLAEIRTPTLVVAGEFDPVRQRSESVAAGIPDAELVVVPGAGHTPHLEAPAQFRDAVLSFLLPSIPAQEAN